MQSLKDLDPAAFARYMAKKYPPEQKAPTYEELKGALGYLLNQARLSDLPASNGAILHAEALLARIPA